MPRGLTTRISGELRTFPRQFWLLAAGTFVYLVGVEMGYPFQTLFMDRVLGVSATTIGLILGATLLATLPMQVVGGALCDRVGRRPVLAVGICGSMTLYIGLGLAHQLWVVVAVIAFEAAFGWAQFLTATNAMVADLTPIERRAEAFSIQRVALNAGITVGPLFAAPLIAADPTFRLSFISAGLVCGIFLLIILTLFKETRPPSVQSRSVLGSFRGYAVVARDRRMLVFCLIALLPLYGFGQIWVTLPIVLGDVHHLTAQRWGFLLVAYGASTAILQYPVIRVLGRFDHMLLMAAASACIGLGVGAAAFVAWPLTFACIALIGFGVVLLIPISATIVSRLAPLELRGRYMGAWTLVFMGGYALGPLLGGWALDSLGSRGAFVAIAAAGLLGAVLFTLLRGGEPTSDVEGDGTGAADALVGELRGERPEQAL